MKAYLMSVAVVMLGLMTWGCSTAPETNTGKEELKNDSQASVKDFEAADPSLNDFMSSAYGYAIFPSVGKGAAGVGGSWGRGEVYENGKLVGYCDITAATIGASVGGQTQSELIVFQDKTTLDQLKRGNYAFAADLSAVVLKAGAAASAKYEHGVAVFVMSRGGLMVDASVGGQKFSFEALQ